MPIKARLKMISPARENWKTFAVDAAWAACCLPGFFIRNKPGAFRPPADKTIGASCSPVKDGQKIAEVRRISNDLGRDSNWIVTIPYLFHIPPDGGHFISS